VINRLLIFFAVAGLGAIAGRLVSSGTTESEPPRIALEGDSVPFRIDALGDECQTFIVFSTACPGCQLLASELAGSDLGHPLWVSVEHQRSIDIFLAEHGLDPHLGVSIAHAGGRLSDIGIHATPTLMAVAGDTIRMMRVSADLASLAQVAESCRGT